MMQDANGVLKEKMYVKQITQTQTSPGTNKIA